MEIKVEVIGMKGFKGDIDGKKIDSGTIYSRVKFDTKNNEEGKNWKGGEAVEPWKMPDFATVEKMSHIPFPFIAVLEVERVTNGTESKEIVVSARPFETMAARATAAAPSLKAA